jgi:hypothetical protein
MALDMSIIRDVVPDPSIVEPAGGTFTRMDVNALPTAAPTAALAQPWIHFLVRESS